MALIDPLDFPQARTAPDDVVRGLEALDPSACIVHLGGPRWIVGKMRPNAEARGVAERMLDNWSKNVSEGKRLSPRGKLRVRFAQLALLGFRPVAQYSIVGDPDARIVKDFEESRYHWLHMSESELFQGMDDAVDAKRQAAVAEVASLDRAKDLWQYAFTRSHRMGTSLTPEQPVRSGFVRQPIQKILTPTSSQSGETHAA